MEALVGKALYLLISYSPNKRSFRGPGGVGRGLDSVVGGGGGKICARELAPVVPRVVPRLL